MWIGGLIAPVLGSIQPKPWAARLDGRQSLSGMKQTPRCPMGGKGGQHPMPRGIASTAHKEEVRSGSGEIGEATEIGDGHGTAGDGDAALPELCDGAGEILRRHAEQACERLAVVDQLDFRRAV